MPEQRTERYRNTCAEGRKSGDLYDPEPLWRGVAKHLARCSVIRRRRRFLAVERSEVDLALIVSWVVATRVGVQCASQRRSSEGKCSRSSVTITAPIDPLCGIVGPSFRPSPSVCLLKMEASSLPLASQTTAFEQRQHAVRRTTEIKQAIWRAVRLRLKPFEQIFAQPGRPQNRRRDDHRREKADGRSRRQGQAGRRDCQRSRRARSQRRGRCPRRGESRAGMLTNWVSC